MLRPFRGRLAALLVALLTVAALAPAPARAVEPVFEFLDALRGEKQGAMAIAYLNMLKATDRVPPELKEVFDLEMARSLQVAADETVNEDEAAKYRKDAQVALEAFLKTGAEHSEAGFAYDTYGNLSMDRGNQLIRQAATQKEAARKEQMFEEARKEFASAKPRFEEAIKRFSKRLEDAEAEVKAAQDESKAKKGNVKFKRAAASADEQRYIAENDWLNARFKLAMLEYYIAQTYTDIKKPEVLKSLTAAGTALDLIYQGYRENRPGVLAHFWHGMAAKQIADISGKAGDKNTAEDIFDEVVARTPKPSEQRDPAYVAFYAEAERQKLMLLAEKQRYEDLIAEGEEFLNFQKLKTDPYYGIALEIAKAYLVKANKLQGPERKKILTTVVGKLRDATKQQSLYHREATALLGKYAAEIGQESIANTFDQAISGADISFQSGDPKGAIDGYLKALELSKKEKETKELKERVILVRLALANARYSAQDFAGSYTDALALAKEDPNTKIAPKASVLAIHSALGQFGTAEDKAAAQAKLMEAANYTMQTWPKRAEADDARIALGRLKAVQGDVAAAMQTFEAVNPASERYPQALQLAAQSHWKLYVDAKRTGKIDDAAKQNRETAVKQLEQSLAALQQTPSPPPELASAAIETPLLLAEIRIEDNSLDEALKLLVPLVDKLQGQQTESLDLTSIRVLVSTIRIYASLKKTTEAIQLGQLLLDKGQDIPPVNAILASDSQMLRADYLQKKAEADAAGPENMGAAAAVSQSKQAASEFLTKLAERKQLGLQEVIVLGQTAADVGLGELANRLYDQILAAEAQAAGNPKLQAAINVVQSKKIGLLRSEKKFDEALTQVNALIQKVPKALEPKVEKARILSAMAAADDVPSQAKWTAATESWAQLRNLMQGLQKKPAEYYEAVYETARGLGERAKLTTGQKDANELRTQARQLLKGTTALAPNLSGPDMVAKYQALSEELQK